MSSADESVSVIVGPRPVLPGLVAMREITSTSEGAVETVLGDSHVILSLQFGAPVLEVTDGGARRLRSHVTGLHLRPHRVGASGAVGALLVKMTPAGAARLLGAPAAALAAQSVGLEDLIGAQPVRELEDRLASAPHAAARFDLVQAFFRDRAGEPEPTRADLALSLLARSGGALRIDALARRLELSTRALEQQFLAAFGFAPKPVARLLRLHAAIRQRADGSPWSAVAAEAGYADQAHLIREFQALAGTSPSRFYRTIARLEDNPLNRAAARSEFFNTFFAPREILAPQT